MSDVILECKNVSIRYRVGDFKNIGLKEWVMRHLTGNYKVNDFWADRHVSFKLERGDMLGIIGTNGAGKSTILKAISGIMEPTEGRVTRKGKISALLELASGFDPDLNVKENAYLRGAMLGYTREFMDKTYSGIVDFAELKEFEDRPFKQLSSGMKSRLAFAIASLVKPEILILDEVLSVGDGAFKKKSEEKMREIIKGGATTILVSHSLSQIRQMCTKILWLEKGRQILFSDDVDGICDLYEAYLNKKIALHHLDSNGGNLNGPEVLIRRVGDLHGELPIPTRRGYKFVAWRDVSNPKWGLRSTNTVKRPGLRCFRAEWKKHVSMAEKIKELKSLIDSGLTPLVTGDYRIIAAPYIRNVGDHLIFRGEIDFLKKFKYKCKGIHSVWTFPFPEMAEGDILFVHGGGFIGDAWGGGTLRVLNWVISKYPDNSIVVFPQSTSFKSREFLEETIRVWSGHRHLVVCARDQVSYDFLKSNFPKNTILLVPDMAFYADIGQWQTKEPVAERKRLLFMRWDCEAKDKPAMARLQQALDCEARDWPTITGNNADYLEILRLKAEKKFEEADRFFLEKLHPHCMREGIRFLAPYQDIHTARLHGLILAMLMDKPRIAFIDNSYGKISAFYKTWLDDVEGISETSKGAKPTITPADVTVIIAAHKRPDTLRVALNSVYAQQDVKVEVIVVNGVKESDPVDDVVHEYPSCIYIKDSAYLTLSSKHELGLHLASAELVHFLDDDDYLTDPFFFKKVVDAMRGNSKLAFVAGSCDRRVEEGGHDTFKLVDYPNQVEGLINGEELFQGLQTTIRKPVIAATVFRKTALTFGEALIEVSDSSLFLKALLDGPAYIIPDKVAVYRVWPEQMTKGRGSDLEFKLNVLRQKEALYRQAVGRISDPLGWWSKTFQMNFNYFEKSFRSSEERRKLAEWGLANAHGSEELIVFCKAKANV